MTKPQAFIKDTTTGHGLRTLHKGQQTKAAIVEAALGLATQIGLDGLSIGALAEVMKMSKSGVFAHFGSREELQISVVREYHHVFEQEVFFPAMKAHRGLPRLRQLFENWVGRTSIEIDSGCIYISGAVESWTVAGAFGQRRFVSLTPLLVLGVAALMSAMASAGKPARRLGLAAIVLATWWNLGLMAQFGLHTMDRERLTRGANAWQTFVALPLKAPALAWQYLTNRASFYNRPQQAP